MLPKHPVPKFARQAKKPPKACGKACRSELHNEQVSRVMTYKNLGERG